MDDAPPTPRQAELEPGPVDRFELALLIGRDVARPIALGALLAMGDWPEVRLGDATLLFESGGDDRMPLHWVLGDLDVLGEQFEAAAERLLGDDIAVVRSAVDDRRDVTSFLFRPDGSEVVVSTFQAPPELRYAYPTAPAYGPRLYDWVEAHLDAVEEQAERVEGGISRVAVDREELVAALLSEARRAAEVTAHVRDADTPT